MNKYQIIYADPPWSYQNGGVPQGGVNAQYPTMKLQDIKNLPIGELAEDTSVLLMWATFPQLREALEVIEAWGFKYKTLGFSWLKTNKDGSPFFGIGYYAKSNQEVCLLGVKGKAHSLTEKIKREVEDEYGMGGLSTGLYGDYASEVAKRSLIQMYQELIEWAEKIGKGLYCTAEHLGYHDKNCEGNHCEKITLNNLISYLKGRIEELKNNGR